MKNFKAYFLFVLTMLLLCLLPYASNAQSAWVKEKGKLYSQLSYSSIPEYGGIYSDESYVPSRLITDNTIQLYAEYGLSDKLTLIGSVPIKAIKTGETTANSTFPLTINEKSKTTLGNITLGLKHKIYDAKFVVSGQLNIALNTSSFDNASGIRSGYDAYTFTPTLNIGRGYSKYYIQGFTGFDIRTNGYSSNFKIGGEAGFTGIKNIVLVGFLDYVKSFENGTITLPASSLETGLYINDQEYAAIGLKGLYNFTPNFGITAGMNGALSANNVPRKMAMSAGVFYKL